ncbi:MAG: penicillin-binding protein 2 [candidate division Zixibacteria bacterium]|nr:penicillin-binding protein 2 [candidate division Zixibacteria bacterium]
MGDRYRLALCVVAVVVLFMFGGLIKLQIVQHDELSALSESNRLRVVPIVPPRGIMYDREGRQIVNNRPSYTLSVVPAEEVKGKTLANLSTVIGLDTTQIRRNVRRTMITQYQPAPIMRDVPFDKIAVLEERSGDFPGISYQMDRVRQYVAPPGSEAFSGYVGELSADEVERVDPDLYRLGSMIGKKGLEKQYDQLLRGKEGTAYFEVFSSGQVLGPYAGKQRVEAVAGADLTLSIDLDLQQLATQVFDSFCCGAIVAMDPRTGEVLALTSYPGFDANVFSGVVSESLWNAVSTNPAHPLLNRDLNGLYPPGSTFKLITVGAGLEERAIDINSTFRPCYGGYQFGTRFFRCWDKGGHGILTATHALEASCDVYMYQLGLKIGIDGLSKYMGACGFGKPTGIDLPGEAAGLNPNTEWYNSRYGKNRWTNALTLNNAIGQGEILTTPIQLAQFYCGLANHGLVYRPHLVKSIRYPNGKSAPVTPELSFKLPFSESTLATLNEGLRLVVEGNQGTARRLKNDLYSIGGKTGTAQNPHGNDHSWFVGVAPLENPEIVCCAIVENAGHGSEVAAPVVGQIIKKYMEKKLGLNKVAQATIPEVQP